MATRQVMDHVTIWVVSFVLLAFGTLEGKAADHPNRSTSSDLTAGRMVDSLFDLEMPTAQQPSDSRHSARRRFDSSHTTIQGRLVRNPDRGDGTPSFALIDSYGGVLRYVEPVNRIDLGPYMGQTIGVRHDTGDTLLASQLALPSARAGRRFSGVQLAGYEQTLSPGGSVSAPITLLQGQEPIYLDEGFNFGGYPDQGGPIGVRRGRRGLRSQGLGFYVGYELTALRPYLSNAGSTGGFAFPGPVGFDDDYGFGHRFVVGYDGGSGLGARFRYWFYNHGHDFVASPPAAAAVAGSVGIDLDVLDLELTLDEQLRNWNLMLSGGFRYGRAGLSGLNPGGSELFFEGVGPTVAIEARRKFGDRGLHLIGNFRVALLYGDWNNYLNGATPAKVEDEITTVFENQLGVGFTRDLGFATVTLRTVWETQFWLNDTLADESNGIGSNLTFAGPTSSVELRF